MAYCVAVDAFGLFRKPFQKGRGIHGFATSLRQRLALLGSHQCGDIVLVLYHQIKPGAQAGRAFLAGEPAPRLPRTIRRVDGVLDFVNAE